MYDIITKEGKSTIQHGKENDRIYLMKLSRDDYPSIIDKLNSMADNKGYSKIFAKIPDWAKNEFLKDGYNQEALIPKFYNGKTDALFLSKYIDPQRAELDRDIETLVDRYINLALSKRGKPVPIAGNSSFRSRRLTEEDVTELAALYALVFKSYPFPIFREGYLKKTMNDDVIYFGMFHNNRLIAASSAETDPAGKNAEMTDFATNPDFAGNNLSLILLREMEAEMRKQKMKTLYTIARSHSPAMNITFAKMDYDFAGTLVNNTNIFGRIESMNVWYKNI